MKSLVRSLIGALALAAVAQFHGYPPQGLAQAPAATVHLINAQVDDQAPILPIDKPAADPAPKVDPKSDVKPDAVETPKVPPQKVGIAVAARTGPYCLVKLFCGFPVGHEGDDRHWRFFIVRLVDGKTLLERTNFVKTQSLDGCRSRLVATAPPNDYLAECYGTGKPYTANFAVGDPPPLVPIATLAGEKDAKSLATAYSKLAGLVATVTPGPLTPTVGSVRENAAVLVEQSGAAASPAVPAINSRYLDPVLGKDNDAAVDDQKRADILAKLKQVGDDLGAIPDPEPNPPGPVPTSDKLWITVIDSAEGRTSLQTVAITDMLYWNAQHAAAGHDYERYETGSPDAMKFNAFIKFPAEVIFQDHDSGKVLGIEQLPLGVTTAWFDEQIAKYARKK